MPARPTVASEGGTAGDDVLAEIGSGDVIVFDGECVLCSGFLHFVLRHDRVRRFRFLVAQTPKGEALYARLGLKGDDYETNLVFADGHLHRELDAFAAVMARLGWPWRALSVARWIPEPLSGWLYRLVATNRYRLFGRRDACLVPGPDLRARFL